MSSEGWHFNICLHSREQQQRGALLIPISASVTLELLLDSLFKKNKKSLSCLVNEHKLTVRVCVCYFAPQTSGFLIRLLYFPFLTTILLLLHFSSRNTDDPEVGLQLQCQLHRPPHFSVHALTAEDGAGTPEPSAGQSRGHWNKHRYTNRTDGNSVGKYIPFYITA